MKLIYRPITAWPGKHTDPRKSSPFGYKTSWQQTVTLLERELGMLSVDEAVLQVDNPSESNFRLDGQLRSGAKLQSPAVILSFTTRQHGKLSYPCDTFDKFASWASMEGWQVNVRAIALGLEALRKVDRYGIANTGQQYTGWQALPLGGPTKMTAEEAARIICSEAPALARIISDREFRELAYKQRAKQLHPDAGGITADFQRLQEAKELLDKLETA